MDTSALGSVGVTQTPGCCVDPLVMTVALALAILECFGPARRAHPGAEARAQTYAAQVDFAATSSRVDPYLVVALIERESSWIEGAVGKRGEIGLMQVTPRTEATKGYDTRLLELFKVAVNIRVGVRWMDVKRRRCGTDDPLLWLSAYKGGVCRSSPYSRGIVARALELRLRSLGGNVELAKRGT
jgi:Transglycosylase SLT domain